MSETTGISWADSTFNPWVGCSKVSPGCLGARCYAESWAIRYADGAVWGAAGVRRRTSEALWRKPLGWDRDHERFEAEHGHRRRVFCASLADVFEPRPELDPWRADLFDLIERTPNLDWLLLTKRPDYAKAWLVDGRSATLPTVWMGVSIENSRFTWRADVLREIPAAVRFVSAEPLLGSLFEDARSPSQDAPTVEERRRVRAPLDLTGIDQVIVGGESGGRSSRPMRVEWAREIRDEVLELGYLVGSGGPHFYPRPAFHFKQWGSHDADGVYRGSAPTSGGHLLDGVAWREIPSSALDLNANVKGTL